MNENIIKLSDNLTKKSAIAKVVKADKAVNESMYVIGVVATIATTKGLKDGKNTIVYKAKDFATECGVSETMMSKAIKAVRFWNEKGGKDISKFSYTKLATIASSPSNFNTIIDKDGIESVLSLSNRGIESVIHGDSKIKKVENGVAVVEDVPKKTDKKTDKKADDVNVTVTDDKGVKYSIPMSILAKYKVEE